MIHVDSEDSIFSELLFYRLSNRRKMHRSKKARGKSFKSFVKTISSFYKSKMSTNQVSEDDEYNATLMRLKEEFVEKFHEHEVSDSSEKLKEYKFLAILGQGAFGLVVICHSPSVSSFTFANFHFHYRNS